MLRFFLRFALCWLMSCAAPAQAVVLWSDFGTTPVYETGAGRDILSGAVKRDDSSSDTLYFKFQVDPRSDTTTEEYFAAFELYEGDTERFGVGNAWNAWAYSSFVNADETGGKMAGYQDLHSSRPEASGPGTYEFPRRGTPRIIVFKIQYVPGGDDLVTVWLNPDLGPGANEVYQPETLITRFGANAAFDEIRLRHAGGGGGWTFSDMAIATSFSDFVDTSSAKPGGAAPGATSGASPFSFHSWQREPGMPHNPIRALAQTRDGYLWLGSDDGIARFDGVRFTPFDGQGALRGNSVRALFGDRQGALWIGTGSGGLVRFQNGRFTRFRMHDGLPADAILSLAEDSEGRLWVGTEAGLVVREKDRFSPVNGDGPIKGKAIATLFLDRDGTMWIGATGAGVFEYRGGAFSPLVDPALEGLLQDPHCLLVDQSRRLWIGAGDDFVLCRDRDQWRRHRIPRHTTKPWVKVLAEEADGTVWAGSVSEGLFQFKGDKLTAINAVTGLSDNLIESLLVDRQGKLWVGTDTALNRLQHKSLFAFGQEEGLGVGAVLGLAEVSPGVIWAARPNEGLYRWEGSTFTRLTAAGLPLRDPQVNALLVTRDGGCWVACARGLLRFKDPQAVADESVLSGLAGLDITALAEDSDGRIWAGARDGALWRLALGNWLRLTNFPATHAVTAIVPEADGTMWIGTDGEGLYRFRNETFSHFQKGSGLLSGSIRTLFFDNQKTLWIGTAGGGLSRLRDGRITTLTTRDGLPENTISQILGDDANRLWLGGDHGIACVDVRELDKFASGAATVVYPQMYGRAEGMASEECTAGFSPSGLKTRSGLLWFSTARGVVVADPRHHATNPGTPTLLMEEVLIDEVPAAGFKAGRPDGSVVDTLRIPPGRHRLQLQYTGLNSDSPEQMRFRYRLEGLDANWVEAGTRRTAFYNYVPPGKYQFRVIACDSDGVWNETGPILGVTASRYFWQTGWVIGLGSLGLLVSVGAAVRIVEKRKLHWRLKGLEQERALEQERTRIAQDLHDEMGAKLCRISFLSEHARRGDNMPDELRHQIASISDASREVLHSLDEIVWAVNPQNDTLEHVASYIGHYAAEYFQMTGIECELDIPAQLPPHPISSQARHHLFLAVHEAFTNILKHSGASRSKVSMSCNGATFEICASDNGNGFDPNRSEPKGTAGEPGDGLHNMRQRLADIGGYCQVNSGPKQGTTIRFVVPLKREPAKGKT